MRRWAANEDETELAPRHDQSREQVEIDLQGQAPGMAIPWLQEAMWKCGRRGGGGMTAVASEATAWEVGTAAGTCWYHIFALFVHGI